MTDVDLHQPPLPPDQHCARCNAKLDHLRGAAYWRSAWYCLTCFARMGAQ